jgi:glucose-1-phosphate cytidylyltransferase
MAEIGGKPMLWHILSTFAHYGFSDFVIALGYKGEVIKDYFLNFYTLHNDLSVDLGSGNSKVHERRSEEHVNWKIDLVNTGLHTQTGGRVRRLKEWVGNETFFLTYGDGLANVDIKKLYEFHKKHGKLATVTAVRPSARFGELAMEGNKVMHFIEKPQTHSGWINGGYFVLEPEVIDLIDSDETIWERGPLEKLATMGELMAYQHDGFWQCMDTLREKRLLESLWQSGEAPWKVWK